MAVDSERDTNLGRRGAKSKWKALKTAPSDYRYEAEMVGLEERLLIYDGDVVNRSCAYMLVVSTLDQPDVGFSCDLSRLRIRVARGGWRAQRGKTGPALHNDE